MESSHISLSFPCQLRLLWVITFSQLFSYFWWPWQVLGLLVRYFVELSLNWFLCYVFLIIRLGLWVFGRKVMEVRCHSHHIVSRVHTINVTFHCWYWPWSPDWGSVYQISLWQSYSFPLFLFILSSLEESLCIYSTSLKSEALCSTSLRAST